VKAPEEGVEPRDGNARARIDILGKARVEGRRELPAAAQCRRPCSPTQGALGGDVQGIGLGLFNLGLHPLGAHQGKPYLGVTWAGHRSKKVRRQHLDLHAHGLQLGPRIAQGANHTVDLGMPGIADDKYRLKGL